MSKYWKSPINNPPHGPRHDEQHRPHGPRHHHVPPHEITWEALEELSSQLAEALRLIAELKAEIEDLRRQFQPRQAA